jgi:hypothetical protein
MNEDSIIKLLGNLPVEKRIDEKQISHYTVACITHSITNLGGGSLQHVIRLLLADGVIDEEEAMLMMLKY